MAFCYCFDMDSSDGKEHPVPREVPGSISGPVEIFPPDPLKLYIFMGLRVSRRIIRLRRQILDLN